MATIQQGGFFKSLQENEANFDSEKFLTEVKSQFKSDSITSEVQWRLSVLREISSQPQYSDVSQGLKRKLTQIFSIGGDEHEILGNLKNLTEIKRNDGQSIELRRFLKREKRTLNVHEYRSLLARKTENTESQILNLIAFFPESRSALENLAKQLKKLISAIKNEKTNIHAVKEAEENIRKSPAFEAYEEYKQKFLREWLAQFGGIDLEQVEGMSPDEIQQLVIEHQRHQMTHLLKTQISLQDEDMRDLLGLHDTLETQFHNEDFWTGANVNAKASFRQWILAVIQSFGMLKGQRYALFKAEEMEDMYLLFGVGIASLGEDDADSLQMVPYIKPLTKKMGHFLEIRKREIGDDDQYFHELRHYILPFIFAFDQMPNFSLNKELISFFTSNY